jgi:hypothetical protein
MQNSKNFNDNEQKKGCLKRAEFGGWVKDIKKERVPS